MSSNLFYRRVRDEHSKLWNAASQQRLVFCVPQNCSLSSDRITTADIGACPAAQRARPALAFAPQCGSRPCATTNVFALCPRTPHLAVCPASHTHTHARRVAWRAQRRTC